MARKGVVRKHQHLGELNEGKTRQKIVDATLSILSTQGAESLSAFQIAKVTGLRRSHVVYYYPQKTDLILAAVKEVISQGQQLVLNAVVNKKNAAECLEAYLESLFRWMSEYPHHPPVMALLHYYGIVDEGFTALNRSIREVGEARIADILHFGKKGTPSRRERELAKLIRDILIGHLTNFISSNKKGAPMTDYPRLKRAIFTLVETYPA